MYTLALLSFLVRNNITIITSSEIKQKKIKTKKRGNLKWNALTWLLAQNRQLNKKKVSWVKHVYKTRGTGRIPEPSQNFWIRIKISGTESESNYKIT